MVVSGTFFVREKNRITRYTTVAFFNVKCFNGICSIEILDFFNIAEQKCAYFCITSDQDSTYDMLATLFTSFLSIKLVRLADRTEERVLPVPVSFILDEFPNIGVVPDFKKKLATARSRRIGMSIFRYWMSRYMKLRIHWKKMRVR